MAKSTVVQVVESFGGGVFQSVSQLCMGLANEAQFIIIHSRRAETPANFKASFPKGTRFIEMPMTREVNLRNDLKTALALRKIIKDIPGVKAVHAHSSKAGAAARMGLLGLGLPVYYSPRGYAFQMRAMPRPKRAFYWLAERLLGFLPATTIACGHDELRAARAVSLKTQLIPNAIDLTEVPARLRKRPPFKKQLTVVCAGRISPQKNFPLFCKVARAFEGKPVKFLWVGGGDTTGVNIPANVQITGWLPHAQAQKEMNKGQVYLHLSAWEGLSRVVLEAMAYGFPLILSNIPGNRELASAGNGYLCANAADATGALEDILRNPAKIEKLGKASVSHLDRLYNWQKTRVQWKKVYGC